MIHLLPVHVPTTCVAQDVDARAGEHAHDPELAGEPQRRPESRVPA